MDREYPRFCYGSGVEARTPGSLGREGAGTPEPQGREAWVRLLSLGNVGGVQGPEFFGLETRGGWGQTSSFLSSWGLEV